MKFIVYTGFIKFKGITILNAYCISFHPSAKPSCLTHLFWYSGPEPVVYEVESEEAVGEPQCLIEWQADDVI